MPISAEEADRALAGLETYDRIVIAVSGGADSTTLMHLAVEWARRKGLAPNCIQAVTVDHGLRAGSAEEAVTVSGAAAALGLAHTTKTYNGPVPAGSFAQSFARDLRYRLLAEAAHDTLTPGARAALLTAHHQDDQAETVLMRLARGSGVDGLAGIRRTRRLDDDVDLVRPLLGFPKARLQASLAERGAAWIDDPSNTNQRFERVRLRARAAARDALGLTTAALALSARRAERAGVALRVALDRCLATPAVAVHPLGWVRLDWPLLMLEPEDIRLRALVAVIAAVGGQAPVSLGALEDLTVDAGWPSVAGKTFGHCSFLATQGSHVDVIREPGRGQPAGRLVAPGETLFWDNRLHVRAGPGTPPGAELRWLTADGRAQALERGGTLPPIPREAVLTLPSLWTSQTLLSAPALGVGGPTLTVAPFELRNGA